MYPFGGQHALLEIEFFSNVILGRNTRIYFCEDMHFYVSSVECVTSFLMWNFKPRYNNFLWKRFIFTPDYHEMCFQRSILSQSKTLNQNTSISQKKNCFFTQSRRIMPSEINLLRIQFLVKISELYVFLFDNKIDF